VLNRLHWLFCKDPCCSDVDTPKKPRRKEPPLYGFVDIGFTLTDDESSRLDVNLLFSIDRKKTWKPCDPSKRVTLSQLASSPQGTRHSYSWDSFASLGPRRVKVYFKIKALGRDHCICSALIDNRCCSRE
jgi:hypothetical protein